MCAERPLIVSAADADEMLSCASILPYEIRLPVEFLLLYNVVIAERRQVMGFCLWVERAF